MKTTRNLVACLLLSAMSALHGEPATPAAPGGKHQQLASSEQVPEGLARSDWHSIRAAYEAGRHAFLPIDGGWQARNPGQQWTAKFDGRGFLATPRDGSWQWGLELESYGFGENQHSPSGAPDVKAEGQRLSFQWDATVQEWWVNDQRGLEHGFVVNERPAEWGQKDKSDKKDSAATSLESLPSLLTFTLTTRGPLTPRISADASSVLFLDAAGATVVNYSGLKVWDADGKVLTSRFEPASKKSFRLLVDERGASYPLTIDPIAQQAYLKPADVGLSGVFDQFGYSVAVSGDTVVIGAYGEDSSTTGINSTPNELAEDSGAAYVFVRSGTMWSQQAYLKASQVSEADLFGRSVAVSGDTVVIGARLEDSSTQGINSAPDEGAKDAGAAFVFVRSGTVWSQQAYLKASQVSAGDQFGTSVAVSGDTVVVGAYFEDSSTTGINSIPNKLARDSGAAYVFVRSGTGWSQQAYLKASQVSSGDYFGYSVAVSGDTVVVGAYGTTVNNGTPIGLLNDAGAACVFERSGTAWSQQAYLKASQVSAGDLFGRSVAVSGDTVVIGAYGEDSSTTGVNGVPNELGGETGAAYVFVRSGTGWSQQAYLKASQVSPVDRFGYSVAVSGDTVVVGVEDEDSSTTGINSTPNEEATGSGAAYVFVRSGTVWSQQAYLKASQVSAADQFGRSVAVSGDTVVVGAPYEDSSTTGIDSTPNELAGDTGAAYIFNGLGHIVGPKAGVSGNAVNIAGGDTTPAAADHTDYGSVAVGRGTRTRTFTLSNCGTENLTLSAGGITLSGLNPGDFTVGGILLPSTILPSGSTTFQVTFDPSAAGLHTATVNIASNDLHGNPFAFAIQGTGVDDAPGNAVIVRAANGFALTFPGVPGTAYIIQYSSDLTVWQPLTGPLVTPENGLIEFTDNAVPAPATRYYRTAGAQK